LSDHDRTELAITIDRNPQPDRSHVVSSFTAIKGAMIDETYAVFVAWDFGSAKKDNLERLRV